MIFNSIQNARTLLAGDRDLAVVFIEDTSKNIAFVVTHNNNFTGRIAVPTPVMDQAVSVFVVTTTRIYQKKGSPRFDSIESYLKHKGVLGKEVPLAQAIQGTAAIKKKVGASKNLGTAIAFTDSASGFYCGLKAS